MATEISFICANCGEEFREPVQKFVDAPQDVVAAPALCEDCGHGGEG